jgi:hypothetical protein
MATDPVLQRNLADLIERGLCDKQVIEAKNHWAPIEARPEGWKESDDAEAEGGNLSFWKTVEGQYSIGEEVPLGYLLVNVLGAAWVGKAGSAEIGWLAYKANYLLDINFVVGDDDLFYNGRLLHPLGVDYPNHLLADSVLSCHCGFRREHRSAREIIELLRSGQF